MTSLPGGLLAFDQLHVDVLSLGLGCLAWRGALQSQQSPVPLRQDWQEEQLRPGSEIHQRGGHLGLIDALALALCCLGH